MVCAFNVVLLRNARHLYGELVIPLRHEAQIIQRYIRHSFQAGQARRVIAAGPLPFCRRFMVKHHGPFNVTYIGTIHELGLDLYQYNEWYVDDWTDPANPVELPMVPAGTLMMASTHAKYSMYYGAISILNQKTEKWETVAGKYVPDTFIKKRPDRRFLSLQSAPVPVPHEVDSWLVAKVF